MYEVVIGRSESQRKQLGLVGTVFLGKLYVRMGAVTSLSNKVYMDVSRAHVVFVAGKRGTGKCLHGDTLITLADGSLKPIRELENDNNMILSLDNNLKIIPKNKVEFFERKVNELINLRLRSGREIKLTPEHPLLTIKGWKPVQELSLGSRIATPRKEQFFGELKIQDHEVKLLAYLLAEGHTKKIVLFSNSDDILINEFKESLRLFDSSLDIVKDKKDHYRIIEKNYKTKIISTINNSRDNKTGRFMHGHKSLYKKRSIREFIEKYKLFGKLSIEKVIPEEVFILPKELLVIFLSRLFSCDGSIYFVHNTWEISYSSSSEKLIRGVQHLLLKFGILSKLRNKKIKYKSELRHSFELIIASENVINFIEQIGFFGIKAEKSKICLNEVKMKKINPNVDTIPKEIWELYKPDSWARIGRAIGYAHPKAMRERIRYSPSRPTLLQIAKVDNQPSLRILAESDIFWDEIVSMEYLEGEFEVYDIAVPETHNFVANDIIVHNSYCMGVIAEEMANLPKEISNRLAILIFDTMGIYWTMKFKNEKDEDLLREWGLPQKSLDVAIYTPVGFFKEYRERGIPTDYSFTIRPNELTPSDWMNVFNLDVADPVSVAIELILEELEGKNYSIEEVIQEIGNLKRLDDKSKLAAENRFLAVKRWGLFSSEATPLDEIIKGGQVTVLDISCYQDWNVKNLVIGLVSRKLMIERMASRKKEELADIESGHSYFSSFRTETKDEMPMVWLMLDEAHEALPKEGKTPATDALVQILREGRQPGISLVLVTQQPGEIHKDVTTQSDVVICHRITARKDIEALNSMMQSYSGSDIVKFLNELPRLVGSALVLDDNSERMYPIRVRPRFTWHGGEAPTAVKAKGTAAEELKL